MTYNKVGRVGQGLLKAPRLNITAPLPKGQSDY